MIPGAKTVLKKTLGTLLDVYGLKAVNEALAVIYEAKMTVAGEKGNEDLAHQMDRISEGFDNINFLVETWAFREGK